MSDLSPLGAMVRRHDPDRFFTALFAPPDKREALFLLYAFNHELARAREVASEPTLAAIRLQWWREVVEGTRRRHEVAGPLGEALDSGVFAAEELLGVIEGREVECEPGIATLAEFRAYVMATAGGIAAVAGGVLGADAAVRERLRLLGAAYGVAGVVRSAPVLAHQGRRLLPEDCGVEAVVAEGRRLLGQGRGRLAGGVIAAGLTGVLARRDFARGAPSGPRGIGDRLAVMWAVAVGRV